MTGWNVGATLEFGCFVVVLLMNNEYGYTLVVPDAPWLDPKALSRLIDAGDVPATLVVGIANTRQRVLEYMPEKAVKNAAFDFL